MTYEFQSKLSLAASAIYISITAATAADTESKEKHNITIAADCVYYNYGGEQQVLDIREENKISC